MTVVGVDSVPKVCYLFGVRGTYDMNNTSYRDPPATLNLAEFAHYLMTTNPRLAMGLLAAAVEERASLPSEMEGKLIEVPAFDDDGTPLYAFTERGEEVYAHLLPKD